MTKITYNTEKNKRSSSDPMSEGVVANPVSEGVVANSTINPNGFDNSSLQLTVQKLNDQNYLEWA